MKNSVHILSIIVAFLATAVISCKETKTEDEYPYLEVSPSHLVVFSTGGQSFVTVGSNCDFSAVSDSPWCTVDILTAVDNNLKVVVAQNTGKERTAAITISCDGLEETVTVRQHAVNPSLTVRETSVVIYERLGLDFSLSVTANIPIVFELPAWIHETSGVETSIGVQTYSFTTSALSGAETSRSGEITVKAAEPDFANSIVVPVKQIGESIILKDLTGWEIDTLSAGMIWYQYYRKYKSANQQINVLEVDIQRPEYDLEIKYQTPAMTLSQIASTSGAIAGINANYELDATFLRSDGTTYSQPNSDVQSPSHLRHWKYEGAFFFNSPTKSVDIQYRESEGAGYSNSPYPNIISGAPVLILNHALKGTTFIGDVSGININTLDSEDYRRHQGVRHPRTAIAITEDDKLLLITVDGRQTLAEGINAADLTEFLEHYFNPKHALNLDGGGSTTMYIRGKGGYMNNDIVNTPIDSDIPNQQRPRNGVILINKKI